MVTSLFSSGHGTFCQQKGASIVSPIQGLKNVYDDDKLVKQAVQFPKANLEENQAVASEVFFFFSHRG